jgi:predicted phosphodiesterase
VLIGVISDAHGHGRALSLGLDLLKREGVDATYFLGDALGYFPSPSAVKILRSKRTHVKCVKGNLEEMLLLGVEGADRESIYKLEEVRPFAL